MHAVLVATNNALFGPSGGVQICTRDYIAILERGGFNLRRVGFDTTHDLRTRVLNRLDSRGYRRMIPASLTNVVIAAVKERNARFVFFNEADFTFLAIRLRSEFGDQVKLVHLSHGLRSTDISIFEQTIRKQRNEIKFDANAAKRVGARLQFEADYRQRLDASLCIAPLDAELDRWLGVPRVRWFGRPIQEKALVARPVNERVGCVSTLNHIPNKNGLVRTLESLASGFNDKIIIRLVGGPEDLGKELSARYSFVEYLGQLNDSELRSEAETWCCFLHPIFDYARGCNTKIAIVLGWGLPVATTVYGVRGYVWDESIVALAAAPEELVQLVKKRSRLESFSSHSDETRKIARLQPTVDSIATAMRDFLVSL